MVAGIGPNSFKKILLSNPIIVINYFCERLPNFMHLISAYKCLFSKQKIYISEVCSEDIKSIRALEATDNNSFFFTMIPISLLWGDVMSGNSNKT